MMNRVYIIVGAGGIVSTKFYETRERAEEFARRIAGYEYIEELQILELEAG